MAKNFIKSRKHDSGLTIATKTAYGITSDMVVQDEEIIAKVNLSVNSVLVQDDMGYFIVDKNRVNDGLACPARYSNNREEVNQTIMEMIG